MRRSKYLLQYRIPCLYHWSRVCLVCSGLLLSGCGGGLQMVPEGERSGVMTYLYNGTNGHMLTPRRGEAFQKIREFCRGPFDVVKEGATKGRQRVVEGVVGSDIIVETWWGIRFRCVDSGP